MTAKIKLNAASGGGSFSLQAPSSSSNNRVFTIPDEADATLLTSNSSTGKIIQIAQGLDTVRQTISSSTFLETTNSVTITPTAASSKILLLFNGDVNTEANSRPAFITVYRSVNGGTYENIAPTGTNAGANNNNGFSGELRGTSSRLQVNFTINYLDSPSYSVGNSIVYKLYVRSNGSAVELQSNTNQQPVVSLAMEVAA